jgi:hypothetical protein
MDGFLVALHVIEKREKSSEGVRDRQRTEMVLEDLEHLETLAEVRRPGVLKQEASRTILQGRPKLTLPKLAGKSIPRVHEKQIIRTGRGEAVGTEPEQEDILLLKIIIPRLDRSQGETIGRDRDRSQ